MELFTFILLLLIGVLASNILHRFFPFVSVPVLQIGLGVLLALLPLQIDLTLDPDLFFILFVAPLVYYSSTTADRKAMWSVKGQIFNTAILLVIFTCVAMGFFVHWLIPAIPIAAAMTLLAALGPTDDVAVASVSKRFQIPGKAVSLLQGESIFNDVSALICFQIGMTAAVSGHFFPVGALGQFLLVGLGGVAVGLVLALLRYLFVRWMRSLGLENVTIHVLIEILMPFLTYYLAERLGVSGILAVFTTGIVYAMQQKKMNPDVVNLKIASDSVWAMLSFALEGIVFLLLGIQLPAIIGSLVRDSYPIGTGAILGIILLISLALTGIRFLWAFFTIPKGEYSDSGEIGRARGSLIFSLSGARGAVTLASIFSIPLLLSSGDPFPQRGLMILLSTGVILCSILQTYFILPLFVKKKQAAATGAISGDVQAQILQGVIIELDRRATPEDRAETDAVIQTYISRIKALPGKPGAPTPEDEGLRALRQRAAAWEMEVVDAAREEGALDEDTARHCREFIRGHTGMLQAGRGPSLGETLSRLLQMIRGFFSRDHHRDDGTWQALRELLHQAAGHALQKLYAMRDEENRVQVDALIGEYEMWRLLLKSNAHKSRREEHAAPALDDGLVSDIMARGIQIERNAIQALYENGALSREASRQMRNNLSLVKIDIPMT